MSLFQLPKLSYDFDAFAPQLSPESFEYHYNKHHKTYVENLCTLLPVEWNEKNLLEIIILARNEAEVVEYSTKTSIDSLKRCNNLYRKIFNNAAQHYNHSFFWNSITPQLQDVSSRIAQLIESSFGTFEAFKQLFHERGAQLFGSGWVWLVYNQYLEKLEIIGTCNAAPVYNDGEYKPLLVCDVWEHAYYIDYHNRRADFLKYIIEHFNWQLADSLMQCNTHGLD